MSPQSIFLTHLVLGYVACLLCFGAYILPRFRSMEPIAVQRVIATVHSFRFFGLVFILPGVVGADLPSTFAHSAAYGDFLTGVLAILALLMVRVRPLFWSLTAAFNLVGMIDLILAYCYAVKSGLPAVAGQLGAVYVIPVVYVPMLMITHFAAFYWLLRPHTKTDVALIDGAVKI
ncbi:MAG TPA: hypothetical protein VHB45_06115 [Alloacidobacterium sp.]|nr:hypothetical protein [Alloacidobacterium sp.]